MFQFVECALLKASAEGHVKIVKMLLLRQDIDVNLQDEVEGKNYCGQLAYLFLF